MASNTPYPDADAHMGGGPALYGNQNGGTPPAQQQQHVPTDPDLQLQDSIAQLQRNTELMHPPGPQGHQMNAALNVAHHQFQTPPRPTHSPQQMAQSVMNLEDPALYGDQDSSRKRSKVSRACDECRRKKIRCDATSENGPEACSSCKRTGARCQFSRQPMKRGPSKGYIKELADRLNSLESQIQNPHAPGQNYDFTAVDQTMADAPTPSHLPRKRTHSMSETLQDVYNRPNWSGQDRDFGTNGQAVRRPSYADLNLAGNLLVTGANEGIIKAYYACIHSVFPLLSQNFSLLNRLTNCPPRLRESLFLSLECAIRSYSPTSLPPSEISIAQLAQQCLEALDVAQHGLGDNDSSRQFYNNIVYCQTLAFLAIASDKPAPSAMASTAELIGRLAGRLAELGINDSKITTKLREEDHDNYEDSRRLFWVSFILDRFHASSRARDTILPLHCGFVSRDDFNALEESGYHLARAADIVGQIAFVARAGNIPNSDPSSPFAFAALTSSSPASLYLNGQLSRFRESLDITNLPSTSPPQLAYQYLCILVARLSAHTASKEILALAKELLANLIPAPVTPLHHVFASLVATSLAELSDRVETQVEAHASMKEMDDAIQHGHVLLRSPSGSGWDATIRTLLHQKRAPSPPPASGPEQSSPAAQPNMAGLQHLAAAAVGEREVADTRPTSSGGNGTMPPQEIKHDVTAAMAAASEAAAAQATAAAAQKQLQSSSTSSSNGGGNPYDPSALVKEGFMTALG